MASVTERVLLSKIWQPMVQTFRFKGRRVNLKKPRPPHYERALLEALVKPIYPESIEKYLPLSRKCLKKEEADIRAYRINNPYENLMAKQLEDLFNGSRMIAICHRNMFEKGETLPMNINFKREGMLMKISSKFTLDLAIKNTKYEPIMQLFTVHQAIIFSPEPKVDVLLKVLKKTPKLVLMAAIVDGYLASVNQLNEYCRLKDIDTARAELVSVLNIGAQKIVSDLSQQQKMLVSQLDQHVAIQQAGQDKPVQSESPKSDETPPSPSES